MKENLLRFLDIHYASPELLLGVEIDDKTDCWAIGCLLYELLTGE